MSSYLRGRSGSLCSSGSTTTSTANGLCDNPTRGRCGLVLCISSVDDMTSSHRVPHRTHRRRRWSAAVLLVSVAAFATLPITPAGHAAAQSAGSMVTATSTSGGGSAFDPRSAAVVLRAVSGENEKSEALSDREREVLRLLADGLSNKRIGETLYISESTVKFHIRNIIRKLGVSKRTDAVYIASKRGLI